MVQDNLVILGEACISAVWWTAPQEKHVTGVLIKIYYYNYVLTKKHVVYMSAL